MPRVTMILRARKSKYNRACVTCGHVIEPGETFYRWSFRYGGNRFACSKHYPKQSQLTQSDKLSRLYGAQETIEDACVGWVPTQEDHGTEDIASAIEEAAQEARDVAEEYSEAAEAMGSAGEENQERSDNAEAWADVLESAELPEWPEDIEGHEDFDEKLENWADEVRNFATELTGELQI